MHQAFFLFALCTNALFNTKHITKDILLFSLEINAAMLTWNHYTYILFKFEYNINIINTIDKWIFNRVPCIGCYLFANSAEATVIFKLLRLRHVVSCFFLCYKLIKHFIRYPFSPLFLILYYANYFHYGLLLMNIFLFACILIRNIFC